MQTIEEKAREIYLLYKEKDRVLSEGVLIGFMKGVEFAQQWISVDEELPEDTQDILMKDEDWENEYCPNGVRLGWYNPTHCKYYTSLWDDNKEEFVTRESTPTHWSPIELK